MPNWCAQKITFKGGNLKPLKELLTPGFDQWYARAMHYNRQFLVLGLLGKLQPIYDIEMEKFPDLAKGVGKKTKANIAYTHWLGFVFNRSKLTKEVGEHIERLAKEANTVKLMSKLKLTKVQQKWFQSSEVLSGEYKPIEYQEENMYGEPSSPLSLYHLVPLLVGESMVPFCDYSFKEEFDYSFNSQYEANVERLGTKWSTLWTEEGTTIKDDYIEVNTKSAWAPVLPALKDISLKLCCEVEVIYAEQGIGYAGHAKWVNGIPIEDIEESFAVEYVDDDECDEIASLYPTYVEELNHFGG